MVTDYDCWREGPVSVPEILRVMAENLSIAQRLLTRVIKDIPPRSSALRGRRRRRA